jgi:hypothetical protein
MAEKETVPVNQETLDLLYTKLLEVNKHLNEELNLLFKKEAEKNLMFKLSSIHYSLINRTIELNNGYITLCNCKNYITAISLLRLQVENCLRLFGFTIMDNMPECLDQFIDGAEFKSLTGNNGKKLYDSYLAKELDKKIPEYNFHSTYKKYCEIVHFSGFYQTLSNKFENKENGLSATLYTGGGNNMPDFNMYNKIMYTSSMFDSSKIIYRLFKEYRKAMENVLINY